MTSLNGVKSNCDVIANFSIILLDSEYLIKIITPSCVTREFYIYLITLKFPSYATREFKFH